MVSPALQAVSQGLMPPCKQKGVELVGSVAVGCAVVVLGLIVLALFQETGETQFRRQIYPQWGSSLALSCPGLCRFYRMFLGLML